mgnify:FL=1
MNTLHCYNREESTDSDLTSGIGDEPADQETEQTDEERPEDESTPVDGGSTRSGGNLNASRTDQKEDDEGGNGRNQEPSPQIGVVGALHIDVDSTIDTVNWQALSANVVDTLIEVFQTVSLLNCSSHLLYFDEFFFGFLW